MRSINGEKACPENLRKSLINAGEIGYVCKAKIEHVGDVALRILDVSPGQMKGNKCKKFKQECRLLPRASRHRHVVRFFGIVYEPDVDVVGLVTDWARGGSLYDALKGTGHHFWIDLPTRVKLHSLSGIVSALCCMHSAGVIHANLKPQNVMLADEMMDSKSIPTL